MEKFSTILIILILAAAATMTIAYYSFESLDDELQQYRDEIGETVILQKDTLMVVDYSILGGVFTLEDGRTVNQDLVLKLEHVTKK